VLVRAVARTGKGRGRRNGLLGAPAPQLQVFCATQLQAALLLSNLGACVV
jgi:hypothetical protein